MSSRCTTTTTTTPYVPSMDPRGRLRTILSHLLRIERDCATLEPSTAGACGTAQPPRVSDMSSQITLRSGHHQQNALINSRAEEAEEEEGRALLSPPSVTVFEPPKDNTPPPSLPSFTARNNCVFCNIVHGRSPAFKIWFIIICKQQGSIATSLCNIKELYEDDICICILDVHPLSHGHALIVPKSHFPSLEFTPPEVAASMCSIVPLISQAILEATNSESFNLLVNNGAAAGQVIFHTHFHIIPRRFGDNLWTSEGSCRRALSNDGETIHFVEQIRHKLSDAKIS